MHSPLISFKDNIGNGLKTSYYLIYNRIQLHNAPSYIRVEDLRKASWPSHVVQSVAEFIKGE